jgi:hypothetical protein
MAVLRNAQSAGGVTLRAVLLGLVCTGMLSVATPYTNLVMAGSNLGVNFLPVGAVLFFLFLVAGLNTLLRRLRQAWALSGRELLVVYVMMLVSAVMPTLGFLEHVLPTIVGAYYLATPENKFATLIHPYLKPWLTVRDPDAVKWFYEGLPKGQAVPWGLWLTPLFWWTVLVLAFSLSMISMAVLVRRQWIEDERLVFPLATVPLEIIGPLDELPTAASSFFHNRWLWLGFVGTLLFGIFNNLCFYYPAVPHVQTRGYVLISAVGHPLMAEMGDFPLYIFPSVIGLGYLLSREVGLSIWLFWVLNKLESLVLVVYGLNITAGGGAEAWSTRHFFRNQDVGGWLLLGGLLLWTALKRARRVLTSAEADPEEARQVRWALIGLIIGTIVIGAWFMAAGMSLGIMILALLMQYLCLVTLTRIVSSAGLFWFLMSWVPCDVLVQNLGTAVVGHSNLTGVYLLQGGQEVQTSQMPVIMDSMRIGHSSRLPLGRMIAAIGGATVVAIIVSTLVGMPMIYHKGGVSMTEVSGWSGWLYPRLQRQLDAMDKRINYSLIFTIVGAAVTLFLVQMNRSFLWWRLSPIGYLLSSRAASALIAHSIFIGWLISGLVLRYGGLRPYRKFRPVFLGMILGEFATAGFWLIVDAIFGGKVGNLVLGEW